MKAKKQQARVLAHLELYKTINPLQAWYGCGVYRLADVIFKLRNAGHNIKTNRSHARNKFGEPVVFANYQLITD